jgi:hypothetical protein
MLRKMTPAFSSSARKGRCDRDAVEHRVDRDLARALDSGEHLLLLDRDAELLVDAQDLGSTSSRLPSFGFSLGSA